MSSVVRLRVADIIPNPLRVRRLDKDVVFAELVGSIQSNGMYHPVKVMKRKRPWWKFWARQTYLMLDGHIRLEAAIEAGLTTVPALIFDKPLKSQFTLNMAALAARKPMTIEEVAEATGHSVEWVKERMNHGRPH